MLFPTPGSSATSAVPGSIYIGTYTGQKSKGIYSASFDPATGRIGEAKLAAETSSPSFLALHPNRKWLYAVGESGKGVVSAFAVEADATRLRLINQQPSGGGGPCHLAVDKGCVLVANYGTGSIAALPIAADGSLEEPSSVIQHEGSSVDPRRQAGPHAHFILPDPQDRHVLACDLGLDKVLVYRLEGTRLIKNDPPFGTVDPGSGPRHLVFSPSGKWVYVVNEMGCSINTFAYDAASGAMTNVNKVSTLPADFKGQSSCAEIQVHPSGKFVYASNRGHDSIAVFESDQATGSLRLVQHQSTQGKTPRHFTLDPAGKWLLASNQDSDSIVVFAVDSGSGKLSPAGQQVEVGRPVCVVFR